MAEGELWIGTDVVDLDRFRLALRRSPTLVPRLFTEAERSYAMVTRDPAQRLAARFAVKEATMKALGVGLGGCRFRDIEVTRRPSGEPSLVVTGRAADAAGRRGVQRWRVSMSHSALVALAVVVALP